MENKIEIYKTKDNHTEIKVVLEQDTVWLSQDQMVQLFHSTKQNISLHISNIFKEGELNSASTIKESLTVQTEGARTISRKIKYYTLDVIISVGYRVKSKEGTQFRIWANKILKDYLVKGYSINEKRLEQKEQEVRLLKNGIQILSRAIEEKTADNEWLGIFVKGLNLLDDYDHEQLDSKGLTLKTAHYPSLEEYHEVIQAMTYDFSSDVFGKEKDNNFSSSIAQIAKGFDELDFYPSLEEKAAMLLYLIVKNHSFVDGNKRIAAACFLKFLQTNGILFNKENETIIGNNTLASLTLFIAASKPDEMETVKRLVVSVLNRNK